jgi:uncharacterized protein YcbK (DUF882 family)
VKREPSKHRTLNRRQLLRAAGGIALGVAGLRAGQARAQWAPGQRGTATPRSLAFRHTHTGEELALVFADERGLLPAALARVNELLRDFRTGEVFPIDPALLDLLSDLQVGSGEPFEVISGYRSPQTNASLRRSSSGVAEHSFHMQGRAIDVRLPGVHTTELARRAQALQGGGVGFYKVSDFVHVDTGPLRGWGDPHG